MNKNNPDNFFLLFSIFGSSEGFWGEAESIRILSPQNKKKLKIGKIQFPEGGVLNIRASLISSPQNIGPFRNPVLHHFQREGS